MPAGATVALPLKMPKQSVEVMENVVSALFIFALTTGTTKDESRAH
jgi:hypothetical protein